MNWVDLIHLGVFSFALRLGYQKGFVKQIATIAGLIGGVYLAGAYHLHLARSRHFSFLAQELGENATVVSAYLGIFAAVVLGAQAVAGLIHRGIKGKALEHVNSFFGGVVGLAKVYAACGILAVGVFRFLPHEGIHRHYAESYLAPRIARTIHQALNYLPAECYTKFTEFMYQERATAAHRRTGEGRREREITAAAPYPPASREASSPYSGSNDT